MLQIKSTTEWFGRKAFMVYVKKILNTIICAICGITERLHIDHCHNSGDVRGLLCSNCNLGIGNLKDNIKILKNAILYLENPPRLDKPHFQIKR